MNMIKNIEDADEEDPEPDSNKYKQLIEGLA